MMGILRKVIAAIAAHIPKRQSPGHCHCGKKLPRDRPNGAECDDCWLDRQW